MLMLPALSARFPASVGDAARKGGLTLAVQIAAAAPTVQPFTGKPVPENRPFDRQ